MFLHYLNKYNDSSFQHIKYCFNKFAAVTFSVIQLYSTQNWKTSKEKKLHSQVYCFIQSRHVFDYDKIAVFYLPSTEDDAESKKRSLKTSKFKLYSYYTTTYGKVTMNYAARISTVTIYVCLFIVLKLLTKAARRVKVVNRKRNGASSSKYNWPTRKRCKKVLL